MKQSLIHFADSTIHTIESRIARIFLGKIFRACEVRGTGGGGLTAFSDLSSTFLELESAKKYLQPLRKQGSSLEVSEIPCVVVQSLERDQLLIIDRLVDTFETFKPTLEKEWKFGDFSKLIMAQLPHGIEALYTKEKMEPASLPILEHHAYNKELNKAKKYIGAIPLGWVFHESDEETKGVIDFVASLNHWLAKAPADLEE